VPKRPAATHVTRLNWPFRAAVFALILSAALLAPRAAVLRAFTPAPTPFAVGFLGWAIGYLLVVGLLVVYRIRDRALRGRPDYVSSQWANARMVAAAVVGAAVGCAHTLVIADGLTSW
jgi:hypothetical protein